MSPTRSGDAHNHNAVITELRIVFLLLNVIVVLWTRSPLNVVHVGLEMLVALIKSADPTSPFVPIDRGTADFIIQMFFSSESAINILNDLLQYEHIEAGIHTCIL